MPKVSIIMATFNAAKTLRVALESVLNQSYQDWECIVVDGASKDDTINIVKEYYDKDSRFHCISEPDKGIYDAFNKGWKMAKGEWIYYLGADDFLFPDGMKEIFSHEWNEDIVYGDLEYKMVRGMKRTRQKDWNPTSFFMLGHQSVVMRRTAIQELGGFDLQYKLVADYDLMVRSFMAGKKFAHCKAWLAQFNCLGASSSLSTVKDGFLIRKRAKLCNPIENICIYIQVWTLKHLRFIFNGLLRKLL